MTALAAARELLTALGYEMQPADDWLLDFCAEKVIHKITGACNLPELPEGLFQVAAQMIAGEFLFAKKGSGQLEGLDINFEAAVQQIQEGDTNIKFALGQGGGSQTPEQRFDRLVSYLQKGDERQVVRHRRLAW